MKLAHTSIVCRTVDNADRFYRDLLGLETEKDFTIEAGLTEQIFGQACPCRIVVYGNDDFAVEVFIPETEAPAASPYAHLCLEVGKLTPFLDRCRQAGIAINQVPKGDKTLIFVRDLDGNLFEIKGE